MKMWAFWHAYTTVTKTTLREKHLELYARWFPELDLLKVNMDSLPYSAGMQSTYSLFPPSLRTRKMVNWTDSAHHRRGQAFQTEPQQDTDGFKRISSPMPICYERELQKFNHI